jgi:hypothetical protein
MKLKVFERCLVHKTFLWRRLNTLILIYDFRINLFFKSCESFKMIEFSLLLQLLKYWPFFTHVKRLFWIKKIRIRQFICCSSPFKSHFTYYQIFWSKWIFFKKTVNILKFSRNLGYLVLYLNVITDYVFSNFFRPLLRYISFVLLWFLHQKFVVTSLSLERLWATVLQQFLCMVLSRMMERLTKLNCVIRLCAKKFINNLI